MNEFNLRYTEKITGRKYVGRGLGGNLVKVRSEDGLEEFTLSKDKLYVRFRGAKTNQGQAHRQVRAITKISSRGLDGV